MPLNSNEKLKWVLRARVLAWITVGYNVAEAAVCAWFGIQEETLAVLGFGGDSLLEALSGMTILWRFRGQGEGYSSGHAREKTAHRIIGFLFLAFAAVLAVGAALRWQRGVQPGSGLPGAVIALVSLAAMLFLYRAKKKAAAALDSPALRADSFATLSCMWLSGLLLLGSLLLESTRLALFDSATSLVIALLVAREGLEGVRGEEEGEEEA